MGLIDLRAALIDCTRLLLPASLSLLLLLVLIIVVLHGIIARLGWRCLRLHRWVLLLKIWYEWLDELALYLVLICWVLWVIYHWWLCHCLGRWRLLLAIGGALNLVRCRWRLLLSLVVHHGGGHWTCHSVQVAQKVVDVQILVHICHARIDVLAIHRCIRLLSCLLWLSLCSVDVLGLLRVSRLRWSHSCLSIERLLRRLIESCLNEFITWLSLAI